MTEEEQALTPGDQTRDAGTRGGDLSSPLLPVPGAKAGAEPAELR